MKKFTISEENVKEYGNPIYKEELLIPCPFCGSVDIDKDGVLSNDGTTSPQCMNCGATADSIKLWNKRINKPIINKKESVLLSLFLEECEEIFNKHRCNDVPEKYYDGWTREEIEEFNHKLNVYNGISDKKDDQYVEEAYLHDFWVLGYFSDFLKKE